MADAFGLKGDEERSSSGHWGLVVLFLYYDFLVVILTILLYCYELTNSGIPDEFRKRQLSYLKYNKKV